MELHDCPACRQTTTHLLDWQFSGLNDSVFNYTAQFYHCPGCGLVFIENIDDEKLARFYVEECSYFEKAHFDTNSYANISKYTYYRDVLVKHGLVNVQVTDIGCGRGGFLLWLNANGWQADCLGVDVDVRSIPDAKHKQNVGDYAVLFKEGRALSLPYANDSQLLLTYFHVFEHIRDLDLLLREAHRVLQPNGFILIEVPDAENYAKNQVGSAFWIGIREHIYHFSAHALMACLKLHGFSVVSVQRSMLPTPEFDYPSLMVIAKKGELIRDFDCESGDNIASFVTSSQLALSKQAKEMISLAQNHKTLTFWGCSSELYSLLPLLKDINFRLCDASELKQQSKYKGRKIHEPAMIKPEGILVVAPYLNGGEIKEAAKCLGWPSKLIVQLS